MGYTLVTLLTAIAVGLLYFKWALPNVDAAPQLDVQQVPVLVKRGKYLATHVAVCMDCHSTRDWSRFSGPPVAGTWGKGGGKFDHILGFPGVFYAKNITPDMETGIGSWTDGEIFRAITSGVSKNGEPLSTLMPYRSYSHMSEEDAQAIVAYLRSLEPIKNQVPASAPNFKESLYLRTVPKKVFDSTLNIVLQDSVALGKYLLTIAGCAECHTTKQKGSLRTGKHLAGGAPYKLPNGAVVRAANITPDSATGIGQWTEDFFINRFKHYANPANLPETAPDTFNTVMPWSMYAGMKEGDLKAIYKYLKSREPSKNKIEQFTPAQKSIPVQP